MTSSNGNIFRVTGPLCREFTGHQWLPPHKGQWREAMMFSLICVWINGWVNNHDFVIWDAIAPIMTSLWWKLLHMGHQWSKKVYHAVSLSSLSAFTCFKIWRWIHSHGNNDFKKDTSNLLDRWIMKQNLHSIADTNVTISKNIFVVWTGLHSEIYLQQIIIVSGSCTANKA